ncbi:hypothetical protein TSAR_008859, partial [Trichomalopsis sarcophagae]
RGSWQYRNDYKITPNRIGLKPRIALSIRAYESQMRDKRLLNLLIDLGYVRNNYRRAPPVSDSVICIVPARHKLSIFIQYSVIDSMVLHHVRPVLLSSIREILANAINANGTITLGARRRCRFSTTARQSKSAVTSLVSNLLPPGTVNSAPSSSSSSPLLQPQVGNSSASTTRSTSPQPAGTAFLNKILEKLNKLDSIEKLQNTMKNEAEENGRLLGERMSVMKRSLEPLDEILRLMNRVMVVGADGTFLRAEQVDIKGKLEQLLAKGAGTSTDSSSASTLDVEIVQQLRESNARIQAQLDRVALSQATLSVELVITGLASTQATSLRLLAYAALKPLDAQLIMRYYLCSSRGELLVRMMRILLLLPLLSLKCVLPLLL